jgi:mannosyl-glycoprotein endo-beta-N-acetylglucosaminidase
MTNAAQPATLGIATVEELLAWTPASDPFFVFNRASVPLVPRQIAVTRMLDCQGLDFAPYPPQGTADPANYTLGYWQSVDIFTFFGGSVCFTTPPPGWINAGHRNGVPVLGTFFARTKDAVGALTASGDKGVAQMVTVAKEYGFDGWFFNVEEGPGAEVAQQLIGFLASLRSAIHAAIPSSLIVWYDALLPAGYVAYQNELNENNWPFFEVCDAIFPNFWWTVGGKPGPERSASFARDKGASPLDVYTPVDCYGRRSPSSGFQSWVALAGAAKADTSVGMFCPAWTWQNANTPLNGVPYPQGDAVLWGGIANVIPPRPALRSLPFVTHFDQGFGNQFCIAGRISNPHWSWPWCNMSQQDILPSSRWTLAAGSAQACSIELSNACPFDGGSCVKIGGDPSQGSSATYELFVADLILPNDATLSFTYAPSQLSSGGPAKVTPDVAIAVVFDDGTATVALSSANSPCNGQSVGSGMSATYTAGTRKQLSGSGAAGTNVTWNVVTLALGPGGKTVRAISLLAAWPPGAKPDQPVPFLDWTAVGEVKLLAGQAPAITPATALACEQGTWNAGAATLNLTWHAPAGVPIRHYDVYQDDTWIGRAFCPALWIAAAKPKDKRQSITFAVRCADTWGNFEDPRMMAKVTLPVPAG